MAKSAAQFLPLTATAMLRRRMIEGAGAGLMAFGALLLAAVVTFDPKDPSLNNAVDAPRIHNAIGLAGSYVADLLMQTFGAASVAVAVIFAAWGWRLIRRRAVPMLWLRLTALTPALLLLAIALAALPVPGRWPLESGLGGAAGRLLLLRLTAWPAGPGPFLAALLAGITGVLAALLILGVTFTEWRQGYGTLQRFTAWLEARLGRRPAEQPAPVREVRPVKRREPKLAAKRAAPDVEEEEEDGLAYGAVPADLVAPKAAGATPGKKAVFRQGTLDLAPRDGYRLPPVELLRMPREAGKTQVVNEEGLAQNARLLESVLEDFGVQGKIVKVRPGPVVTLYELEPAPGTKTSRVIGLADDIARSMSAVSVRIAVIPGRNVIGIELPNAKREMVYLRELLASEAYERTAWSLTLVLGKDISGAPILVDLARMPHLLIAGTTGSGKSVGINTMILSLLYRLPPDQCKFIMIDPKMLELSVYEGIPHLLAPVVTEPGKAVVALKWVVREMEDRYRAMSQLGVRNIAGFNARVLEAQANGESLSRSVQTGFDPETGKPIFEEVPLGEDPLPFIVVVVDEMADLMLVAGKDVETAIQRLAQMARAAGIHLLMATQRPSVDVITGTIKANFPTRISFQVTSKIDSRTILGEQGAEQLLGQGDMLYMAGGGRITRVHGPFVSDEEVEAVVRFLKAQGPPSYIESITEEDDAPLAFESGGKSDSGDDLYDQAVALVCRERKASTSFVQRHLQIGYNRAARLIERMEAEGVVGQANHVGKREVLARSMDD